MKRRRHRRAQEQSLDTIRRRLIAETELALMIGLRFPDRVPRIPTVETGRGTVDPAWAERFWAETLGVEPAQLAALCGVDTDGASETGDWAD